MLPPSIQGHASVDILDVDTGEVTRQRLESMGQDGSGIPDQVVATRHFRWIGKDKADVWYDAQGSLQRLATIDDGHPTEWIRIGPR